MAKQNLAEPASPDEYRDILLRSIRLMLHGLSPHPGGLQEIYPFRLDVCDAERVSDLLLQVRAVVRQAVVIPLAPEADAVDAARADVMLQQLLGVMSATPTPSIDAGDAWRH